MAVLLGLLAAMTWGLSTYLVSRLARGAPAVALTFWTQIVGIGPLVPLIILLDGNGVDWVEARYGLVAGLGVGVSLALLYISISNAKVGIVSSVAGAVGTLGPVVYSMATGVMPSVTALLGILLAIVALIVLTVVPDHRGGGSFVSPAPAGVTEANLEQRQATPVGRPRRKILGIGQAALSGLAMTVYYIALSGIPGKISFWVLTESRVGAALAMTVLCVWVSRSLRLSPRHVLASVVIGATGALGAAFYLLALGHGGMMVLVVPIVSLSPAVAVVLAWALEHERLSKAQVGALFAAVVGILAVVSG